MSLLVVGTVALDTIKTPFGKEKDVLGGSATYFSVSASNFCPVNLVAIVGQDFPSKYIKLLKNKSVGLEGLTIEKGLTFRWEGEYSENFSDPKTLATHLNLLAKFNPKIPKNYQTSKYLFLANIDPQIQMKVLKQVNRPKLIACDTMNYWIKNSPQALLKLLKHVDIFILNESEAKELTKEANLIRAGKSLIKLGPESVIIKKGEHGVLLFAENNTFAVPAFLLETIIDPTGAGDTFAGGFMGYLARSKKFDKNTLRKAVVYGCIMATFAVENFSLRRLASVTTADINQRINEFKKFTTF